MCRNVNNKIECVTQERKKKQSVYTHVHTHPDEVSATVLCNSVLSLCIYARIQEERNSRKTGIKEN